MFAARLELYSRELKIKVLVKKLKPLDQGIEICCKSTTGSLRSRFL
jgi:hypothetical protein